MNKIALSLVALAAISTVSFAGDNRNYDLRDTPNYNGQYADQSAPAVSAFAVKEAGSAPTLVQIIKRNMEKNASSSHSSR
jgi:hypothetical protein